MGTGQGAAAEGRPGTRTHADPQRPDAVPPRLRVPSQRNAFEPIRNVVDGAARHQRYARLEPVGERRYRARHAGERGGAQARPTEVSSTQGPAPVDVENVHSSRAARGLNAVP
jgi:hypothetical protein